MPISLQTSGTEITAEVEHRKGDGTLIYKSKTIPEPVLPEEPMPSNSGILSVLKYIRQRTKWQIECQDLIDTFNLIQEYHDLRAHYAGANRNKDIPIQYRTGEPYPKTKEDARAEIKILKKLIKEEGNGTGTSNTK